MAAVTDVRVWSRELTAEELAALFFTSEVALELVPAMEAMSLPLLSAVRSPRPYGHFRKGKLTHTPVRRPSASAR